MNLQLNQKATGCFLEAPTERLSGAIMRDLLLYLELLSLRDQTIDFSKDATLIVKDSNGKPTLVTEAGIHDAKYKLYANYPVFLNYKFCLHEKEWKALLDGVNVSITIEDEFYDVSYILKQLVSNERSSNNAR